MELRDLAITPVLIILVYVTMYFIRPYMTDSVTRRYFFPALTVKILGALALGFIYQFYYHGGDTFNFHTHGSRIIWNTFWESPSSAIELLFTNKPTPESIYRYSSQIYFISDSSSFFVIRMAAFLDLLTASSYSGTAVFFGLVSFWGAWAMFVTFYRRYPHRHVALAIATMFIPSVAFWGSGILKDTVIITALGFSVYCVDYLFIQRRFSIWRLLLLLLSLYVVFMVKKFILQAFVPTVILWIYYERFLLISSWGIRLLVLPVAMALLGYSTYYSVVKIGEGDTRYSVEKLAVTAKVTAYDIGFYTGKDAGSGYSLGELDGSFQSMMSKVPSAINVSLFRPYLWEVNNPLMFLSSMESLTLLFICLYLVVMRRTAVASAFRNPDFVFCLLFSLVIAFAVGITSYNFGTLARYKIPLMPFFALALTMVLDAGGKQRDKTASVPGPEQS